MTTIEGVFRGTKREMEKALAWYLENHGFDHSARQMSKALEFWCAAVAMAEPKAGPGADPDEDLELDDLSLEGLEGLEGGAA